MNYNRAGNGDLSTWTAAGVITDPAEATGLLTLVAGTTYYMPLGGTVAATSSETALLGVHLAWSAALTATITLECSNMPRYRGGKDSGPADVSAFDATAGNWIQENPSTAVVSVSGTGNSATALTVTAGGTNAGGCIMHLGNLGTARQRLKIVVGGVGGTLRARINGKLGS